VIKSSKKAVRKRRMVLALDKACRKEIVEERDGNTCQRCGASLGNVFYPGAPRVVIIQWAHIHTREYYVTRWESDNSLALCDCCHVWFDNHKVLSYEWFRKKYPERWEHIQNVLRVSTKTSESWIRAKYLELTKGASQ
jgi:hypothetical protein